ncbi:PREDICTED: dr1-associated corepressor-like [Amphimedon queenslandica]|uniref:Transcription factor CBF/NF-Y/archaeal histone domain-containing protein n=1 Tax=Amphimedon queenslandica TaxID=400682 RepID=A0A1X7VKE0_AMPQE|nr:PREDICTED: dr1-associated corepressor-like [Amphimedon queenslandica]|eukprot:XP_003383773.1 PREDICTED: dr1-associated corepressor-like [Amphimedon queenslandica]
MPPKRRKFDSRFPAARIKKIMQLDDDVGRVATAVPILISRAVEIFLQAILTKSSEYAGSRNAKTLTVGHLKHCIEKEEQWDFLKDLTAKVPDVSGCNENEESPKRGRKRKNSASKAPSGSGSSSKKKLKKKAEEPEEEDEDKEQESEQEDESDTSSPASAQSSNSTNKKPSVDPSPLAILHKRLSANVSSSSPSPPSSSAPPPPLSTTQSPLSALAAKLNSKATPSPLLAYASSLPSANVAVAGLVGGATSHGNSDEEDYDA